MPDNNEKQIDYYINPNVDSRLDFERQFTELPKPEADRIDSLTSEANKEHATTQLLSGQGFEKSPRYRTAFYKEKLFNCLKQAESNHGYDLLISDIRNAGKEKFGICLKNRRLKRYSKELYPLIREYIESETLYNNFSAELQGMIEKTASNVALTEEETQRMNDRASQIDQDLEALQAKMNEIKDKIQAKKEETRSFGVEQLRTELIEKAEAAKQITTGEKNLGALVHIPENTEYETVEGIAKELVSASETASEMKENRVFSDDDIEIFEDPKNNLSSLKVCFGVESLKSITLSWFNSPLQGENNTFESTFNNYRDRFTVAYNFVKPLLQAEEGKTPLIAKIFNLEKYGIRSSEEQRRDIISTTEAKTIIDTCPGISNEDKNKFKEFYNRLIESSNYNSILSRAIKDRAYQEYTACLRNIFNKIKEWLINDGRRGLGVEAFNLCIHHYDDKNDNIIKAALEAILKKQNALMTIGNKIRHKHEEYQAMDDKHGKIHSRIYQTIRQMHPSDYSFDFHIPDIEPATLKTALETIAKAQKVQRERQLKSAQPFREVSQRLGDYSEGIVIPDEDKAKYDYVDKYLGSDDLVPSQPAPMHRL